MKLDETLKKEAIKLRREGKSYNEIIRILSLKSKGTLSCWFKGLQLSKKSHMLLKKNNELAYKRGLHEANRKRTARITEENRIAVSHGMDLVRGYSLRELLFIGAALYWGEGTKSERNYCCFAFVNSDPKMVFVFMRFIREVLLAPENVIRAGIHIYKSIDRDEAKAFWSSVTGLSKELFYIVVQVSRIMGKKQRPQNTLPFGTVVIKLNGRKWFFLIKGMIEGLAINYR
jgi:transposase-like protein